jgi:hypothetical protein
LRPELKVLLMTDYAHDMAGLARLDHGMEPITKLSTYESIGSEYIASFMRGVDTYLVHRTIAARVTTAR